MRISRRGLLTALVVAGLLAVGIVGFRWLTRPATVDGSAPDSRIGRHPDSGLRRR